MRRRGIIDSRARLLAFSSPTAFDVGRMYAVLEDLARYRLPRPKIVPRASLPLPPVHRFTVKKGQLAAGAGFFVFLHRLRQQLAQGLRALAICGVGREVREQFGIL